MTPIERFDELVGQFVGLDGVIPPHPGAGFGSSALRVNGRIFAMLVRDELVVKLPAARVSELVDRGDGSRFDANKGKPMKEWLALAGSSELDWSELTTEAMEFVRKR